MYFHLYSIWVLSNKKKNYEYNKRMIFYFKTKEWVEEVGLILISIRMMLQLKWEVYKKMNLSMLF